MKIKMADVSLSGYCHRGVRAFLAKHDLDLHEFRTVGIDAQILRDTGDQMAIDLADRVEAARGQE